MTELWGKVESALPPPALAMCVLSKQPYVEKMLKF